MLDTCMGKAVHLAVAYDVFIGVSLCCPFSHEIRMDKIWDLIGSVSQGFPTYFCTKLYENYCACLIVYILNYK